MSAKSTDPYWRLYWPLILVASLAAIIIAARMKWPSLTFDNISLVLFGIATGSVFLPLLLRVLPPLKRLKVGPYEFEFEERLKSLETKVRASEHEAEHASATTKHASPHLSVGWQEYFREYNFIISSAVSNVEKILAAANVVERMILDTASAFDLVSGGTRKNTRALIREMEKQGLITEAEHEAFTEFSNIRNDVVHGGRLSPTDSQTARFLDLGWRLVQTFA